MTGRTLGGPLLVVCLLGGGQQAMAQEPDAARAEVLAAERERLAREGRPDTTGRLERMLDFLEHSPTVQRLFAPRDGIGVRIGGIENGPGLAAGPVWRRSGAFGGALDLRASGAAAISRDYEVDAGLGSAQVAGSPLSVTIDAFRTHLAAERFYGSGIRSDRGDQSSFSLDRRGVRVEAAIEATPWLRLGAATGLVHAQAGHGRGAGIPPAIKRWSSAEAPGIDGVTGHLIAGISGAIDFRDVPGNPRAGGLYEAELERYVDTQSGRYSFDRLNLRVEHHLSGWRRQRTLTLRAEAALSHTAPGHEVPFHLQPTLGGSRTLRGFVSDRFRDRQRVVLQAEYGWDIWPFLNAVLFYETGTVAPEIGALALDNLRRDYGLGFRLGSARTVALRTDVALGSGEGTRITMRLHHAF